LPSAATAGRGGARFVPDRPQGARALGLQREAVAREPGDHRGAGAGAEIGRAHQLTVRELRDRMRCVDLGPRGQVHVVEEGPRPRRQGVVPMRIAAQPLGLAHQLQGARRRDAERVSDAG